MMSRIFQREMKHLEQELLTLSAIVEENVMLAMRAAQTRDRVLAEEIRQRDVDIDRREVQLEEECLKILALHQPVAVDLRVLVASLKINNDLERVGDLAVGISRSAIELCALPELPLPEGLKELAEAALALFGQSLDCFINFDTTVARSVCDGDAHVDAMYKQISEEICQTMKTRPETVYQGMQLHRIARALERVGDHASNIAEDVIYMLEGGIVRHRA